MQRGEAVAVVSIITITGVFATAGLLLTPTGNIAQGETFYPIAQPSPIACASGTIVLETTPVSTTYCCIEAMIGENTCRAPFTLISAP